MEDWMANLIHILNHKIDLISTNKSLVNADKGIKYKVDKILSKL